MVVTGCQLQGYFQGCNNLVAALLQPCFIALKQPGYNLDVPKYMHVPLPARYLSFCGKTITSDRAAPSPVQSRVQVSLSL